MKAEQMLAELQLIMNGLGAKLEKVVKTKLKGASLSLPQH